MATTSKRGVDLTDALIAPLFVAASFVLGGLATVGIDQPFSFHFSDVLYSAAGTEISWAFIFTMIALLAAWLTNEARDLDDYNQEQMGIIAGMVLLNFAAVLVPAVSNAFQTYWYAGILLVMINGAGYFLLAYY